MRERLGEEFAGTVSAVTTFGLFVTLDALYVEGLVHITELGGEYFKFDEVRQELRGERTGIRYAIGARVRVQVSRVDLDGRKIDFRIVREGEEARARCARARQGEPSARDAATSEIVALKDRRSRRQGGHQGQGACPFGRGVAAVAPARRRCARPRARARGARGTSAPLTRHDQQQHRAGDAA